MGDNGAGDQMRQLAKSLEGFGNALAVSEENKIKAQQETIDLDVSRVMAGIGSGDGPIDPSAIDDFTSDKHPVIKKRILQGVGSERAMTWIQSRIESIPTEVRDDPALFAEAMNGIRKEALGSVGTDPFYGSGFMKVVENTIGQYSVNASSSRAAKWNDIQDSEFNMRLAYGDPDIDATFSNGDAGSQSDALLRKFEGFRETPYWDVTAHRVGYGSDTITRADGSVVRVQPGMRVSKEDAERDLSRRRTEFQQGIVSSIGAESWSSLSASQQASLTSIAYNYGSLPKSVTRALKSGAGVEGVAKAIEGLKGHNDGVNASRRQQEADIFRSGGATPVKVAGAGNFYSPKDNTEDASMILHRFNVMDPEFKVTSSLTNARRRDALADTLLLRALQKNDPTYLDAMPEHLMTPQIMEQFSKARPQIEDNKYTQAQRAKQAAADAKNERITAATDAIINDRANGLMVDPVQYATNEKGVIDSEVLFKVSSIASLPFVDARTSQQNATNFKNELMSASATGNWESLKAKGLTYEGASPSANDVMNFIRTSPEFGDTDKQSLMASATDDLDKGAFLANPRVQEGIRDVEEMVTEITRSPQGQVALIKNPNIKTLIVRSYEQVIKDYVTTKGIPREELPDLLEKAEAKALARLKELMASKKPGGGSEAPAATGSAIGTTTKDSQGKTYKKVKDGPDNDITNWEEVE
jgi:GH24 family phage-related lysozyme (muramidase)